VDYIGKSLPIYVSSGCDGQIASWAVEPARYNQQPRLTVGLFVVARRILGQSKLLAF
jgi:hypothetical protein